MNGSNALGLRETESNALLVTGFTFRCDVANFEGIVSNSEATPHRILDELGPDSTTW